MMNKKMSIFFFLGCFAFYDCVAQNISDLSQNIVEKINGIKKFFLQKEKDLKKLPQGMTNEALKEKIQAKKEDLAFLQKRISARFYENAIEGHKKKLVKLEEIISKKLKEIEQLKREVEPLKRRMEIEELIEKRYGSCPKEESIIF